MVYRDFQGKKLSLLGFGAMRLPKGEDGSIREDQVREMVAYAMQNGVNYFDTAYFYHKGESERVMGRVLGEYPRESYYLATKYPGHEVDPRTTDPRAIFEDQLKKCGVEYFDFYLLHNVNEGSLDAYLDSRWGILEYLKEEKSRGRIRHLGFSAHGDIPCLERFLDHCGRDMEFGQIQLNWLDWTLQNARGKYALLEKWGIPVWTMESVRGGRLANLSAGQEAKLKAIRPEETAAAWGFRYLKGLPGVHMILSGMSSMEHIRDNIRTFSDHGALSPTEVELLAEIAAEMMDAVPCTACRYCCDGCSLGLDIPGLLAAYNELRFSLSPSVRIRMEKLPPALQPSACIGCGKCARSCPQNIDVPGAMKDLAEKIKQCPV